MLGRCYLLCTAACLLPLAPQTKNVLLTANADGKLQHWHASSGKLLHTEPRFRDVVKKDSHVTPAPGSYRPRYTLTESRHNI